MSAAATSPLALPMQAFEEATESFIADKRLGERIKHLRSGRSMGLVELGRQTGLSASFLSQLETGRVVPTLRNLARIALVFQKDLSYFFEPEPKPLFRLQRGADRPKLPQSGTDDPSYYFESLAGLVPDRQIDPYLTTFLPARKGREVRAHQHSGCEFLYLMEGQLEIRHGAEVHTLAAGDSVYFDAGATHSYASAGAANAVALIVTLQPQSQSSSRAPSMDCFGAPPKRPSIVHTGGKAPVASANGAVANGSGVKTSPQPQASR